MADSKKRRRASVCQYEPLTTPEKWSGDEKRFALRLTQLMDELFEKHAAIGKRLSALEERMEKEGNDG